MTTCSKVFCVVMVVGFWVALAHSASATKILFHGREFDATFGDDGPVLDYLEATYGEENVTYMAGADAAPDGSSADGFDVILLSAAMASSDVRGKYYDSPVGIVNWENALIHDGEAGNFFLSDRGGNDDSEILSEIDIVDPSHPLAAGLSGTVTVYDPPNAQQYGLGELGEGVTLIASSTDDPDRHMIFAADVGGALLGDGTDGAPDTAAGRRVMFFLSDFGFSTLTADGLKLFDAAVNWAAGLDEGGIVLQAGDADQDLDFDQLDLVKVQVAAKYLTGQPATWGDGDWNGAPGGSPGAPPAGDNLFNQLDIIAALNAGFYLQGPYAAIKSGGAKGDGQASLVYHPGTGELSVDAPAGKELTSLNISSAGALFIGAKPAVLDGSFDNFAADNIFKATFGSSFGSSTSFGNVLPAGMSEETLAADLTVVGSLAGGGDLGEVDLVFVPEPGSLFLLLVGLGATPVLGLRRERRDIRQAQ